MNLADIPERAVALIEADSYFADITVTEITSGELMETIGQALAGSGMSDDNDAGAGGLCVIVGVAALKDASTSPRAPRYDAELAIGVLENPLLNFSDAGTKKRALEVAGRILHTLTREPLESTVSRHVATRFFESLDDEPIIRLTREQIDAAYNVEGGNGWLVRLRARNVALGVQLDAGPIAADATAGGRDIDGGTIATAPTGPAIDGGAL